MASSILTPALATASVQTVVNVMDLIDRIQNAPKKVQGIRNDLRAMQPAFEVLLDPARKPSDALDIASRAIDNCQASCAIINGKLASWTKLEDGVTKWDAVKIGTLRNAQLDSFRSELHNCKSTVMLVLQTANILQFEELANKIDAISLGLAKAGKELSNVHGSLALYKNFEVNQDDEENEEDRTALLKILKAQEASIKHLQEVYAKELARITKTVIDVHDVQADTKSFAMAGLRLDNGSGDVNIKVKQVSSRNSSAVYTGIVATETTLFKFHPWQHQDEVETQESKLCLTLRDKGERDKDERDKDESLT